MSSDVSRAGRRALLRQSHCDLQHDAVGSTSSSNSSLDSRASHSRTATEIALKSPADTALVSPEMPILSSPKDEACFVDFQQKQVGECDRRKDVLSLTHPLVARSDFIAMLPLEIAAYILSLLPHHSDVLSCSLVSREWSSLCHDSQIWKRLFTSRSIDGWALVDDLQLTWTAVQSMSRQHDKPPVRSVRQDGRRRGRCVLVDDGPLVSSNAAATGDATIESIDFDLTRTSIQTELDYTDGIDWFALYQARFFLTKRWSLADGEPKAATMESSWSTNSRTSTASGGSWSVNEKEEISLKTSLDIFQPADKHLKGHKDSVYCVRFDNRPFQLPDEMAKSLRSEHRYGPLYDTRTSLGLGSYGKILSGSRDRTIRIWDGDSGICLHTLFGHDGSVLCLEYDDEFLFSASSDQTVIVWSLKMMYTGLTPTIVCRIRGHSSAILDLAIDDRWLITCGKDTTVRVHDRQDRFRLARTYTHHCGPVNAGTLACSPIDGKTKAVTVSGDGGVQLWDVESGSLIRSFVGHAKGLACVKFFDDRIVTGSNDTTVRVWDASTGDCLCVCKGHEALVRAVGFDSRRKMILSGGYDGKVKLFYLGRELHENAVLPTDGSTVDALWDIDAGHEARVFDVQMDVSRILCCGEDNKICVRDYGQGSPLMRLFV